MTTSTSDTPAGRGTTPPGGEPRLFGARGRLGAIVPANNSVLEPELWSRLPEGVALHGTRVMARGDVTPEAVRHMAAQVARAADELAATEVDVILYADMVTTFIMDSAWNERETGTIAQRTGIPCISAWITLRDALAALRVRTFALGTPYPRAIHALCRPFFAAAGFTLSDAQTLDIIAMRDVPRVTPARLRAFVAGLDLVGAEAIVLLATDLPTFSAIGEIERETGRAVLTSNQTLLWSGLRRLGHRAGIPGLGRLFDAG